MRFSTWLIPLGKWKLFDMCWKLLKEQIRMTTKFLVGELYILGSCRVNLCLSHWYCNGLAETFEGDSVLLEETSVIQRTDDRCDVLIDSPNVMSFRACLTFVLVQRVRQPWKLGELRNNPLMGSRFLRWLRREIGSGFGTH